MEGSADPGMKGEVHKSYLTRLEPGMRLVADLTQRLDVDEEEVGQHDSTALREGTLDDLSLTTSSFLHLKHHVSPLLRREGGGRISMHTSNIELATQ